MTRMKMKEDYEKELSKLEDLYTSAKSAEQEAKRLVSDYGNQIKQCMKRNDINEFGTLSVTYTQKEEFNEEQAIEILRLVLSEDDFSKVVKTKEYIDDDALENLAYNSNFDMSVLAPCKSRGKEIATLRIKK